MLVRFMRLPHGSDLPLPAYQTPGSVGLDLRAAVPAENPLQLQPHQWLTVPTGLSVELPDDVEGQVRPRSGLAARHGVTVLNAPGTIDPDYRGEVSVILINHSATPYPIHRGDRIAQLVLSRIIRADVEEADRLGPSQRAAGGFGSTGLAG